MHVLSLVLREANERKVERKFIASYSKMIPTQVNEETLLGNGEVNGEEEN